MPALSAQQQTCARFGAAFVSSPPDLMAGVARNVLTPLMPINGLRHPPKDGATGWYIWAGDVFSADPDVFAPYHIEHLKELCPSVLPYLGLAPGWRFLIADG